MSEDVNIGHYHEIMDRVALIERLFDREIVDTLAVSKHSELADMAYLISHQLADFYQLAGRIHHEMDNQ